MFLKNVAYLCFKRKGKLALPVCEKSREYKNVKFPWYLPFFLLLIDNFFRERGGDVIICTHLVTVHTVCRSNLT